MRECIFCQIAKGESPSYTIYQNEIAVAFLDINPVTAGHTLVIPNKHFDRLDTIHDEEIQKGMMDAIVKVSNLLISSGICSDFTVLQDNGMYAEQDIMHAHFHIIPRHPQERIKFELPTDKEIANEAELLEIYRLLHSHR